MAKNLSPLTYKINGEEYALSVKLEGNELSNEETRKYENLLNPLLKAILDQSDIPTSFENLNIAAYDLDKDPKSALIEAKVDDKPIDLTNREIHHLRAKSSNNESSSEIEIKKVSDAFRLVFPRITHKEDENDDENKTMVSELLYSPPRPKKTKKSSEPLPPSSTGVIFGKPTEKRPPSVEIDATKKKKKSHKAR